MSETHGTQSDPQVIEFDVEGHGLLEVAACLSAAAVVAGASGALTLDNPMPGTTSGAQQIVVGVQGDLDRTLQPARAAIGDPTGTVDQGVRSAASDVRDARAGVVRQVERVMDTAQESFDFALTTSRELYGQVDPRASIHHEEDRTTVTVQVTGKTASVTVG